MGDTAETERLRKTARSGFRKIWWMRFWLPVIALGAWGILASTAVSAYHLSTEGVVTSAVVTEVDRFSRTDNNTVRFTTADGRQIETTIAPKTCELKEPGSAIQVRYVASDPHNAQDTCDQPRHDMSVGAALAALATTALSVQAWRLWRRHRRTGQLPSEYPV
jgi:hypothetical protein